MLQGWHPQLWSLSACGSGHIALVSVCLAGVLTKLDIMDPGTNAREVLEGAAVKLKHGWIGVVNRGQADINSRVGHAAFFCRLPGLKADKEV